jgi:hypothetical protein
MWLVAMVKKNLRQNQRAFLAPRRLRDTMCDAYTARLLHRQPKAHMLPSASASSSVLLGSGTAAINVRVDEVSFALPPPPLGLGPTDWARIPTMVKVLASNVWP